eukprot:3528345-Pleurochrysis_carterae.AAC.1
MRWGGHPAHCRRVASPMRKECQLYREASSCSWCWLRCDPDVRRMLLLGLPQAITSCGKFG